MIAALFYLQWHSLRNQLRTRIKRLRQPKYLMGALVGGAYMYFYFFRYLFISHSHHPAGFLTVPKNLPLIESVGALVLFVIVLMAWIFPSGQAALHFTETEVAFLFPAPLTRRQLIQYRVVRTQVTILVSAFFLTLFARRFGGNAFCHALGWWLILATLSLHFTACSFVRGMLLERGLSNRWRRLLVVGLVAVLVAVVWQWARTTLPPLTADDMTDAKSVLSYAQRVLTSGPLPYLLYPFRLVMRPFLSPNAAAFFAALAPAALIYLAHYLWVINSNVAFEEASVVAAQKTGAILAAARSGNLRGLKKRKKAGRPWFRLAPTGPAFIALMWKNLLGVAQVFNLRLLISISVMMVVFALIFTDGRQREAGSLVAAMLIAIALGYSLLLGPQVLRLDFRADLPMADILKTYPLRGWQISLGEILAPTAVLAGFQWLLLLAGAGLIFFVHLHPAGFYLAIALGAALVLPPLDGLLLIIQNIAAVLFPAWVPSGRGSPRGVEVMGQRLIMGLAQLLVMVLSLVPAAIAFAAIFFPVQMFARPELAILPAAFVAALVVAGEAALGIMWLGKCFDRFDVAEDPAG